MPFSHNRYFKRHHERRLLASAKGAYYTTVEGDRLFDCLSGLWCVGLGHGHPRIAAALRAQYETMDYSPAFQMGYPETFRLAARIAASRPPGSTTCSSSTPARRRSTPRSRSRSRITASAAKPAASASSAASAATTASASAASRSAGWSRTARCFRPLSSSASTTCRTRTTPPRWRSRAASRSGARISPTTSTRIVALHDASTIAAVVVEPMQGSAGVIVPPVGYLERLRELCTRHGILLVFDEVITGFGRMGAAFAAERFGVVPDMITFAKGVNNGAVPLGGVIVRKEIYDAFMTGPEHLVEFFHGYTYSGHPMAVAAAHATLDVLEEDGTFARVRALEPVLEEAMHSLKGEPGVVDVRNLGLAAAVDLEPIPGQPGVRALKVFEEALRQGQLLRFTGDTIAVGPPFISTEQELARMADGIRASIRAAR